MFNRCGLTFICTLFCGLALAMDTPPESPKQFGVHSDLNSFLKMLQQSPQRVAAVTAFLTRTEDLSQAAKKGAVSVVTQSYQLAKLSGASVQGHGANVHDKLYFVRGKDGDTHGFMGSANLTNNQWSSHETVVSWRSPDRRLPGFTDHLSRLLPAGRVRIEPRQNATAARIDALFADVDATQASSAFPYLHCSQGSEQLDACFANAAVTTTPQIDWSREASSSTSPSTPIKRSGGVPIDPCRSGGKRARSEVESGDPRPLKKIYSPLLPNPRAFYSRLAAQEDQCSSSAPLQLWESSPSTRIRKTDSVKRPELISSFDFNDGDLIPWLGHRISCDQKCDYLLSSMTVNHPDLIKKIEQAAKAGSGFKILVDKKSIEKVKSREKYPLFKLVGIPNVEVRCISGGGKFGIQHSKVFTRKPRDKEGRGLSVVSTANFTKESSAQSNHLLALPEHASKKESFKALEQQFLDRWNKASVVK